MRIMRDRFLFIEWQKLKLFPIYISPANFSMMSRTYYNSKSSDIVNTLLMLLSSIGWTQWKSSRKPEDTDSIISIISSLSESR